MMVAVSLIQIIPVFTILLSVGHGHFTLQGSRESYHYDGNHKYWPIRGPSLRPDAGSCVKLPATSPKIVTAGSVFPLIFLVGEGASHVGECIGELYDRHTGLKVADLGKEVDCVANSQKYTATIPDGCTCSECVVRVIVHANHIPSAPETYDSCVDIQIHPRKVQEYGMEPSTFPGEPIPVQETKEGYEVNTTTPPAVIPSPLPNVVENTPNLGEDGDEPVESQAKGTAEVESGKSGNQYVQKNEEEEMLVTEAESGKSGIQYVQKNEEEEMLVTEAEETPMISDVENQDCQCKSKYQVSQVSDDELKTNKATDLSSYGTKTDESLKATQSPVNKTTEDNTDTSFNEIEETIIGTISDEQSSQYQTQLNSVIEEGIDESSKPDLQEGDVSAVAVEVNKPAAATMESTQSYQSYAMSETEVEEATVTTQTEVKHGYTVSNGMADTFKPEIRRRRH